MKMNKKVTVKQIYMMVFQNCLVSFKAATRNLGKDELTLLELHEVLCTLEQKLIQRKTWLILGI